MATCRKHGFTEYIIFENNRKSSCRICRSTRSTPTGRVEPNLEEAKRLADLKKAKLNAIANNETVFKATCRKHGLTDYMIEANTSRCILCRESIKQSASNKYRLLNEKTINCERLERNIAACKLAKAEGLNIFIGECGNHGVAPLLIETHVKDGKHTESYRCLECRKTSQYYSKIKKRP